MLTPEGYKNRIIEKQLDEYIKSFGAVCIEGPKYCGKTWTARSRSESGAYLGNPENNFQTRTLAKLNPLLVLEGEKPHLLDEWQEVPELWDAVRFAVDQTGEKGQYILTGSATPNHKGILHSGTGRIGKIRMNTMSLFETGDSSGKISLMDMFNNGIVPVMTGEVDLRDLIYYVVRGGWPSDIGIDRATCGNTAKEYLKTIVDDDMFSTDGIKRDSKKVWSLIHSLGRNESTVVTNATIRKDISEKDDTSIDPDTIADYLSIFNRLFLIDDQPAFNPGLRSSRRVMKSVKRHFVDTSLAAAALGATQEMLLNDLNTFGFLFEALCEHDLKIYANKNGASLFHFRDEKGNEADAIIELPDGRWAAFEIKLGANQIDSAAAELIKIKDIMKKEGDNPPAFLCVICGMTNAAYQRPDGVIIVPITALKD
ncbi:MAG: ATP-binding protein [Blautia sp.]|nr:ATP-binding protein [Blautia sp.]